MSQGSVVFRRDWFQRQTAVRALAGIVLGVAIAWSFLGTIGNPACQDQDFGAYYRAAIAVRQGHTPYTVDEYGPLAVYSYAPAFAYGFIPLTDLGYLWACRIWLLVNWLATFAGLILAFKLLSPVWAVGEVWSVLVLALVPTSAYLWANLRVGQVAMLMVLGCLAWAYCQRQGHRFLGGMLLATASALKLAPLALVPYLVIQRDWRGLAGLLVGGVLLLTAPAAWVGWEGTCRLHREWIEHTAATQVPVQIYRPGNQSLLAQLARLPPVGNGHQCFSTERLAQLTHFYPFLLAGGLILLYAWILLDRGRGANQNPLAHHRCESLHLALLLIVLTLAHPRAWRCNFVALVFPCLMLAQHIWRQRPGYRIALTALGMLFLACVLPTHGLEEQGWSLYRWLLLGKHFWGGVAIAGACWWTCSPACTSTAGRGRAPRLTSYEQPYQPDRKDESSRVDCGFDPRPACK